MAEGARLESACTGNRTGGSNPPLSAQLRQAPAPLQGRGFFMAPAIELVPVSPRGHKNPGGAPKAHRGRLTKLRSTPKGNQPALRARRNPLSNPPALRARRNHHVPTKPRRQRRFDKGLNAPCS